MVKFMAVFAAVCLATGYSTSLMAEAGDAIRVRPVEVSSQGTVSQACSVGRTVNGQCATLRRRPSLVHVRLSVSPKAMGKRALLSSKKWPVRQTRKPKEASEIPSGGLALVVVDQQVDFHPGGTLAIPTANGDADRIAAFIDAHADEISQLVFTLDSHQRYHIAHGIFWTNAGGQSPAPFTAITNQDIQNGVWMPRDSSLKDYVLAYTNALESSQKFVLTIWPEHCVIGTPGHNIVSNIHSAALAWAKKKTSAIQYVLKGTNSFTEH